MSGELTLAGITLPDAFELTEISVERQFDEHVGVSGALKRNDREVRFSVHRHIDAALEDGSGGFGMILVPADELHWAIEKAWDLPKGEAEPMTRLCQNLMEAAAIMVKADPSTDLSALQKELAAHVQR